jgi:hypothetical protein
MRERKIYLTNADVQYIYEDLKSQGLFEYYITLKIIDEVQLDYTFLTKLSWRDVIENETIIDVTGQRDKEYYINEDIRSEVSDIADLMNIEDLDDKIVRTPARVLSKYLNNYERIKHFKENTVFRLDNFREHTTDINGIKTYMMRTIEDKTFYNPDEENVSMCFLYIAVLEDKFKDKRPVQFQTNVCPDKKIGISKVIGNRMETLSRDKKHGGTLSPIYVKALRAWVLPTKLCRDVERHFHKHFISRNTEGEWFTDYEEDIIPTVEKYLKKLKRKGDKVIDVQINNQNSDITYVYEVSKSFFDSNMKDETFSPKIKYEF